MAEAQLFVSQDEFTCSVCLDTLTDPVTIACGHSFCRKCWDQRVSSPPSQNYSCLTCPASYCQTHLQPHFQIAAWKDHKLVDPDKNLKENLCEKHQKHLEIFCKTDDECICTMCGVTEHNGHKMIHIPNMALLYTLCNEPWTQTDGQQFVTQHTHFIMYNIYSLVPPASTNPPKSRPLFPVPSFFRPPPLLASKTSAHFRPTPVTVWREAAPFIQPGMGSRCSPTLLRLHSPVWQKCRLCTRKDSGCPLSSSPQHFRVWRKYFCPITLDINTAHRDLHLSERNKKVTCEGTKTEYSDHPDRFDHLAQVLCRESLTGTRCYWEVECSGHFMKIGVAYKGLNRKGRGWECGLGNNNKSWCLQWSLSQYSVHHNYKETVISTPYSPRIGVYLDWPAGSLSFYSVSHTMTLLHRFNTSFTEPLHPGFCLGWKCSVTICHLTSGDH
uniref:Tripartite motif-containing protein 16-like n=1 Tax=Erpetoichthys calabaricus TaxID=27687 RepID=A0A8C4STK5_ERPCA